MITLITGAPGSGKTLYCIDKLIRPVIGTTVDGVDAEGNPQTYNRRIFSNINGLLLDHVLVDGVWLEGIAQNRETGAFIVFDEVQRVWPNRAVGSKKPAAVEYLETHRHDGVDVVLMTQNPQLLDPAVRALVGRHLHMRRVGGLGAALVYEWDACSNNLNYKNAFSKTPYWYNKTVFKLYTSSRAHTKQTRKLPFAVWMALAGVAASVWLWPQVYGRIRQQGQPLDAAQEVVKEDKARDRAAQVSDEGVKADDWDDYVAQWKPRVGGLPQTAPRYDDLTRPVRVPVPAACMRSERIGCRCFTQQATPLPDVPRNVCDGIVDAGIFMDFDPEGASGGGGNEGAAAGRPAAYAGISLAEQRGPQSGE